MKKVFLILVFALTLSTVSAWEKRPDEGVFILATKHLSAEAQTLVKEYLGDSYNDDMHYLYDLERAKKATHTKEIHFLHLNDKLESAAVDGNDAFKGIEQSLVVIKDRNNRSKEEVIAALRTMIQLMCDMHNFSRVRIEGVPHSQAPFSFTCFAGDIGKRKTPATMKWSNFWNSYGYWHGGFSGDLWGEDLQLSLGHKREEFSAGSLNDWIAQIGADAAKLYERINPEYVMTRRERNELEELSCEMMARAGFRIAVLLNEIAK